MCGRYALHSRPEVIALAFGLAEVPAFAPRYNIAPAVRRAIVLALLLLAGCAERPYIGIEISNSPPPPDCIPGSATRPCR